MQSPLSYVETSPLVTETSLFHTNLQKIEKLYEAILSEYTYLDRRHYQPWLAAIYSTRPHNICVGGQGLGKTLIAGLVAALFITEKSYRPGSIQIAVPSLLFARSRWLKDLSLIRELKDNIEIINSDKQVLQSQKPCWVYSHDFLKRRTKYLKTSRPFISRLLIKHKRFPKLLICDEAHHLHPKSLRMQHFQILRKRTDRVLLLSGTLADDLEHLHCLLKFCYQKDWPLSKASFLREFQTSRKTKSNYLTGEDEVVDLPKRYLPQLSVFKIPAYYELLKSKVHRVTLNDPSVKNVVKLPQAHTRIELVELDAEHQQSYRYLVQQYLADIRNCRDYQAEAKALQIIHPLIASVNYPTDKQVTAKTKRCVELVQEFQRRGIKTVVFHNNVACGRLIYEQLQKTLGSERVVRLYAEDEQVTPRFMSLEKREETLAKFLFSDCVDAGVFSIRLAGESLDLLQASGIIFYDLPWEVIKLAQAISRCVRPGAIRDFVEIVHLVAAKTIDQYIFDLAHEKIKQMNLLLDYCPDQGYDPGRLKALDILGKILSAEI